MNRTYFLWRSSSSSKQYFWTQKNIWWIWINFPLCVYPPMSLKFANKLPYIHVYSHKSNFKQTSHSRRIYISFPGNDAKIVSHRENPSCGKNSKVSSNQYFELKAIHFNSKGGPFYN